MLRLVRKLLLGTASVLALGIGGTALNYAVDAETPVDAATAPAAQTSDSALTDDLFRKDSIRWAQVELRYQGLYHGSLDGILGPETRQALAQFQKGNGLGRTGSLDAQTWQALIPDPGVGQGSSMSLAAERVGRSDLGR